MQRILLVIVLLFVFSAAALADEKGDALVKGWITRIPKLLPLTAETTTTYKIGNLSSVHKRRYTLMQGDARTWGTTYQFDDEYPFELFQDPLAENLNVLFLRTGDSNQLGLMLPGSDSRTKFGEIYGFTRISCFTISDKCQ